MKTAVIFTILVFQASVLNATWVSPTAHNPDSEEHWSRCWAAYDGIENTYAMQIIPSSQEPLELLFAPSVYCNGWSLTLGGQHGTPDSFDLWLYQDGFWNLAWDGSQWEASMGYTTDIVSSSFPSVSRARIISDDASHALYVSEFKLKYIPEPATILFFITGSLLLRLFRRL